VYDFPRNLLRILKERCAVAIFGHLSVGGFRGKRKGVAEVTERNRTDSIPRQALKKDEEQVKTEVR